MDDIFGTIQAPEGVVQYNVEAAKTGGSIGVIIFASRALQLVTIGAGIWVLFNIIMAGLQLVSAGGKADAYSKAIDKITMSVVGIGIIVASYTVAALIGLLLYGDATYILNPKISGPIP